jgi:flagellar M-ring protein FliF
MKDQLTSSGKRIWQAFQSFTPGQKAVTIAAILALTIGGYLFSAWASKPAYAPLFTNLSTTDASAIVDKLNASKTPYQLAEAGTEILVPQSQVYPLRLTMSAAGLPATSSSNYSLITKEGVTTSDFQQNVDYQVAVQTELDKTIESINGVTAASVHLAIPTQSVFNDGTDKTTASVLLTLVPGTDLAEGMVQSVVNLVSASVPNLDPSNVSISDTSGRILSDGTDGGQQAQTDAETARTQAMNTQLAQSIQTLLDPIAGPGNAVVAVNANLNFDQSTIVQSSNVPLAKGVLPIAVAQNSESYGANASGTSGVLGASSPSPSTSGGVAGTAGPYVSTAETVNNASNLVQTSTSTAPGTIRNLNVSVLVNKNVTIPPATLDQIVSSAVGFNAARGDKLSVQTEAFNNSASTAAAASASKAAALSIAAQKSKALMSEIKTGAIVLAVIIVIIMVMLSNRRRKKPEEPDDLDMFLKQLNDNPGALPPAPVDIVGPKSDAAQSAAEHQRQLSAMAEDDPDEVARLLRSWLNSKDA